MPTNIAAQMYTLREFTKTPADIAKTCSRVKKLGFDAMQISAFGPIDPQEMAKILKNEGLTCCATHVSLDRMRNETQKVIDEHKLWNPAYTAIGGFFPKEKTSAQTWLEFIADYNAIAKKFAGSGVQLGYHNHSHELTRFDDHGGKTVQQMLLEGLDSSIWMEIDTYWIQHGGGDPAQWITKWKGRIPCVHLKDMRAAIDGKPFMAEVGVGNLNWPAIMKSCKEAGVKWYIIEQDVGYRDPFDSLKMSLENVKAML